MAQYLLSQHLPDTIALPLSAYPTVKACWDQLVEEHRAKSAYVQNNLEVVFFKMMCPKGGNVQTFLTELHYKCEELVAAGVCITEKEYECTVLQGIPDKLVRLALQLLATVCIVYWTSIINIDALIGHICEEVECLKNCCMQS